MSGSGEQTSTVMPIEHGSDAEILSVLPPSPPDSSPSGPPADVDPA